MTPTPYYQDALVTIYHGDCREVLPQLDCGGSPLVTDPPYGIRYDASHKKYKGGIDRGEAKWDAEPFDPCHLLRFERAIIWGGNCFTSRLPDSPQWLTWCKTARDDANIRQADTELAWTRGLVSRSRIFHHLWIGAYRASESGIRNVHPTQKPVALMKWCVAFTNVTDVVLDPYCGSGPTLRAAKDLGRKSIGIELEERYCEIAAERCRQEVLDLKGVTP